MKNKDDIGRGVTFVDVNVKQVNPNKTSEYLCNFLTLYFGTLGTVLLMVSSFDFDTDTGFVVIMTALLCLIPYMIFYIIKKKFFTYLIVIGLFFVFVAIFCRQIIESGAISINTIINGISIPYKLNIPTLNIPALGGIGNADMQLFIYLLTFIIAMVVGYVVFIRHSLILAMALPVSIALFCISFDVMPSALSFVIVMAYLMSVLSMSTKPKSEINPTVPTIVFGMILAIFIVTYIFIPSFNYHRFIPFENVRVWVTNTFNPINIDYLKNTDIAHGGINGVQLGAFDEIDYSNIDMFTLKAASNGGNLYYRSFYGASYINNSWVERALNYELFFNNAKQKSIDANVQTTILLNIMDADEQLQKNVSNNKFNYETDVQKQEYNIDYINASTKYWYLPYASAKLSSTKSSRDGYPVNNSKGTCGGYSYNVKNIDYNKIKVFVDTYKGDNVAMRDYVGWESQYRKYVYDAYTYLPQDSLEDIKTEGKKHSVATEAQKQVYINEVILDLKTNYKYTLTPGKVPQGKDFVEYFIDDSKEGYCTYFATAATLMFRAAGIPARYVEGYTVFDSNIKSGVQTSNSYYKKVNGELIENVYFEYTIIVKDSNAHAWVEVYEDGYGWVPIEVTPGVTVADQLIQNNLLAKQSTQVSNATTKGSTDTDTSTKSDNSNDTTTVSSNNGMNSDGRNSLFLILVATMILVITGMIIIWYLMYQKARKSLSQLLSMKSDHSTNVQILEVYKYIERLCGFLGISKLDWMDYEDYAKYLKEKLNYFSECNIDAIINTVLMVRFGNCKALEEDALQATVDASKLREMVYLKLRRIDKIKFRYFNKL